MKSQNLIEFMQPALAVVSFYQSLTGIASREKESKGSSGSTASYGCLASPAGVPSVVVTRHSHNKTKKASGVVWERRHHTFEELLTESTIIVGWQIVDNWGDGTNGDWTREGGPFVGTNHYKVSVEGEKGRGINWTFNLFTVEKSAFPWL